MTAARSSARRSSNSCGRAVCVGESSADSLRCTKAGAGASARNSADMSKEVESEATRSLRKSTRVGAIRSECARTPLAPHPMQQPTDATARQWPILIPRAVKKDKEDSQIVSQADRVAKSVKTTAAIINCLRCATKASKPANTSLAQTARENLRKYSPATTQTLTTAAKPKNTMKRVRAG